MREFFHTEASKKEEQPKPELSRETLYKISRQKFSSVFKSYPTGKERVDALVTINKDVFGLVQDGERIKERLLQCSDIEDREEFLNAVFDVMKPIIDYVFEHLDSFASPETKDRIQINEFLSVNRKNSSELCSGVKDDLRSRSGRMET